MKMAICAVALSLKRPNRLELGCILIQKHIVVFLKLDEVFVILTINSLTIMQ